MLNRKHCVPSIRRNNFAYAKLLCFMSDVTNVSERIRELLNRGTIDGGIINVGYFNLLFEGD